MAINNYYLTESTFEIDAMIKKDKVEIPANLKLVFYAPEANTRVGILIKIMKFWKILIFRWREKNMKIVVGEISILSKVSKQ